VESLSYRVRCKKTRDLRHTEGNCGGLSSGELLAHSFGLEDHFVAGSLIQENKLAGYFLR
jgi:hypothetical protein